MRQVLGYSGLVNRLVASGQIVWYKEQSEVTMLMWLECKQSTQPGWTPML